MRSISIILCVMLLVSACKLSNTNPGKTSNTELAALFNNYWEGRMKLFPLWSMDNSQWSMDNSRAAFSLTLRPCV